jgi:hypothetical protein
MFTLFMRRVAVLFAAAFVFVSTASHATPAEAAIPQQIGTPQSGPVQANVTGGDIALVSYFENLPLFLGADKVSTVHFGGGGSHDGCTVGYGVNLSWRSPAQIREMFTPVVGKVRAAQFVRFSGLYGHRAQRACPAHGKKLPYLTSAEASKVLGQLLAERKAAVIARARKFGALDNTNAGMMSVMLSLDWQSPTCSSQATKVWELMDREHFTEVARKMIPDCRTVAHQRRAVEKSYFLVAAANINQ